MYYSRYVCRLCGTRYRNGGTSSKSIVFKAMSEVMGAKVEHYGVPVSKLDVHFCHDGSFGLADFQGFEYVDVEDEE